MNALVAMARRIGLHVDGRPFVVAHRGASRWAPENTITSLDLAIEHGADAVEFDVRVTADEELVLMHDARLGRTVPDTRLVARVQADAITTLDAGKWLSHEFRGELVPLLDEALTTLSGRAIPIIEVKDGGTLGVLAAKILGEKLAAADMKDKALVASAWTEVLEAMSTISPRTPRVCVAARHATALEALENDLCSGCLVWWRAFAPDLVETARTRRKFVAPWVVPNDRVQLLADAGVDAILTDEPKSALQILEGAEPS